ncbi:MAG TPA: ATP-binding protein [Candidatus Xenobia bacterium]|jgi:anti-sigma regulatory factor (Ser/Thr protein kinase)/CheY-like chemotaxis protein
MNVLLFEEDSTAGRALRAWLHREHFVLTTRSADEVEGLLTRHPHLQVLLLQWTPGTAELLRRVRSQSRPRYLFVIVLATAADRGHLADALDIGADAFLQQPVEVSELQSHIKVARRICDLEERLTATQRLLLQAEREKKRFYAEVLQAVTRGRLHLVEPSGMPAGQRRVLQVQLTEPTGMRLIRLQIRREAEAQGLDQDRTEGLVTAAGEAMTNALRHAVEVTCEVWADGSRLLFRVTDKGKGIEIPDVPAFVLIPGRSSKRSLGAGFEIMLRLVDDVWLATGPQGTVVQLAQDRFEQPEVRSLAGECFDLFHLDGCG